MDYETFLVRLLAAEEDGKRGRRADKLRKEACFEAEKRLEDIDYSFNQSLDKVMITRLGRLLMQRIWLTGCMKRCRKGLYVKHWKR